MSSYDPNLHHRSSGRLGGYDYSQPGAYFITICTHRHQLLFGEVVDPRMVLNSWGDIVRNEWFKSARIRHEIELFTDEFVVMPNHVHGIIWIVTDCSVGANRRVAPTLRPSGPKAGSIGAMIGQFKSKVTKRIRLLCEIHGESIWQRNFYDHIIRDESDLNSIRNYIIENPHRWSEDCYFMKNAAN